MGQVKQVTLKHIIYRPFPKVGNIREVLDFTGEGFMFDVEEKIRIGSFYPVTQKSLSKVNYNYVN